MDILNTTLDGSAKYGNVGQPSGGAKIDHFTGIILHYDGFSLTQAQRQSWASVLSALQSASIAAIPEQRIYPIHHFNALTDSTPAPEKKTSGYGNTVSMVEKPHTFEIELEDFGIGYGAELRKFNDKSNLRAFFVDPKWIGGELVDGNFQGFEVDCKLNQVKVGNVADYTKYILSVQIIDPQALTDNLNTIPVPTGVRLRNVLKGCLGVDLTCVTGGSKIINVKAVTGISQTDLYDLYSTELAVVGAWVVKDSTGTVVTPSGVVKVPASKAWAITVPSTGAVTVEMASPTALAAILVGSSTSGGFVSDTAIFTVV